MKYYCHFFFLQNYGHIFTFSYYVTNYMKQPLNIQSNIHIGVQIMRRQSKE